MLKPLQDVLTYPENVPVLTKTQRDGIQARLNAGLQISSGTITALRKSGHSEEFILGYLAGLTKACDLLDDFETIENNNREEREEE